MTRVAQVVFALLVAATFGAFFVAQRLKHSPTAIQQFSRTPVFSPNHDSRFDRAYFRFKLKKADDVRVEVVDHEGDVVRTLADSRFMPRYTLERFAWDGLGGDGRPVPDGTYRLRLTLRREGRSVTVPKSVLKDTRPPAVTVTGIGPVTDKVPRPELLPEPTGKPAVVHFETSGVRPVVQLFRTGPGRVAAVGPPVALPPGADSWTWDGQIGGRAARPGTYLVSVEARDRAGNIGHSVPIDRRTGLPLLPYGTTLPGHAGITVRPLAAQTSPVPVVAGQTGDVFVDARGRRWTWSLRRVGGPPRPIRRGRKSTSILRLHAPTGASGVYLLSVRTTERQQRVPLLVQSGQHVAGTRAAPSGVLVLLPWITWQGRNPADDDGDGRPNLLDDGLGVRLYRPWTGDGLPAGFATHEAPVLGYLDRHHHRYDLATDATLGKTDLRAYKGVLIPGDMRWLPLALGRRLRAFARSGGTVVSLGTDSLMRQVRLTPRGRAVDPAAPDPTDVFGERLRPLQRGATTLTIYDKDPIGLFVGGDGQFDGYRAVEPTDDFGEQATRVSTAVTPAGRPVIAAARFGRGLVIRTGLPDFATRLSNDPDSAALMSRMWVLLARGAKG